MDGKVNGTQNSDITASKNPCICGLCKITVHLRTTPLPNQKLGYDYVSFVFISKYNVIPNSHELAIQSWRAFLFQCQLLTLSREV